MFIKRLLTYSILSLIAIGGFFGNIDFNNPIFPSFENTQVIKAEALPGPVGTVSTIPSDKKNDTIQPTDSQKLYNSLIDGLNVGLGVLTLLVSPAIMLAGWLMSPDWTSGDLFGLREPMYRLWVTVSNIVYFVYAVLLILIALGTMLNQEKFSYKVMLPKLALGILMVPFTWWFVQWTISLSSVLTASVLTIPAETIKQLNPNDVSTVNDEKTTWWTRPSVPKVINIREQTADQKKATEEKAKASQAEGTKDLGVSNPYDGSDCKIAGQCMAPSQFLTNYGGMYSYMMVYAYSVFNFQEVKKINTATDHIGVILQLVNQSIVSMIMFMIFGLLTLALVAMLLTRAIKLWVYAIFSPLFTFRFVAGSNVMGGEEDTFTIKEFIGLAFVPAIVGLTLSFGLIMVGAVTDGNTKAPTTGSCTESSLTINGEGEKMTGGCELASIMGSADNKIIRGLKKTSDNKYESIHIVKFGGMSINYYGKVIGSNDLSAEAKSVNSTRGILSSTGGVFGTIVVDIIALMFIWLAFMAAKNVSKAVKAAVQPFEDIGNKIGGLAKKIPQYTPLPIPGGSVKGLGKAADMGSMIMDNMAEKRFKETSVGKFLNEKSGNTANVGDKGNFQQMLESGNATDARNLLNKNNAKTNSDLVEHAVTHMQDTSKILRNLNESEKTKATELIDLIKKGTNPKENSMILAAILSGERGIDVTTAKSAETKMEEKYKKYQATGQTVSGVNNLSATFVPEGITINLDATNKLLVKDLDVSKDVFDIASKFEKTTNIKNRMTKEDFKNAFKDVFKDETKLNAVIKELDGKDIFIKTEEKK